MPWRESKFLALAEFALVLLIFIADWKGFIPFSKTPFLLLLGWISLRLRKIGWRNVGLTPYRSWGFTLALGIACGVALEAVQLFVTQPAVTWLSGVPPDLSDFRELTGNIQLTLALIALSWLLAAFGEEMVYRGYLMNRVADLGNRAPFAWILSLMAVSLVFGVAHAYQGATGVVVEGLAGLWLGLMYLGAKRNLLIPVIAHGVANNIDFVLIFWGAFPGL